MGLPQENEVQVRVSAETSALKPGMDASAQEVERASERMRQSVASMKEAIGGHMTQMVGGIKSANDSIGGELETMAGAFGKAGAAIGAAFAAIVGGALFRAAVEESKKLTGEANALARAWGISTTEASALNVALGDIYSSSEAAIGASQMLGRQLRTNEEALNAMGLKTRDANGEYRNMRDLMFDAIKVLNDYKEGTDRNLAAQAMFGRGGAEVMAMLKLNNEVVDAAKQKQEELGLIVGTENVAAAKAYRAAMNDVDDIMSAIRKTIGDAVMPVLTKLGEWFAVIGPTAVTVIKGAVGGLIATFWALKNGVVVVWETINAMVVSVTEPIRALSEAIGRALTGDFSGAKDALIAIPGNISSAWKAAFDEIGKSSEETSEKIANLFMLPTDTAPKDGKGKNFVDPKQKEAKPSAEKSRMSEWEAELAAAKLAHEQQTAEAGTFQRYMLSQELEFWEKKKNTANLKNEEIIALEKRTATLRLEILRKGHEEELKINAINADSTMKTALARVDADEAAAKLAKDIGAKTQAEILADEENFENRRNSIRLQALQEKFLIAAQDPERNRVELAQIAAQVEELERQHQQKVRQIRNDATRNDKAQFDKYFDPITNAFEKSVNGMIQGTLTFQKAVNQALQSVALEFANLGVKMGMEWLKTEMFKTRATAAGTAERTAIEGAAAGESLLISAGKAIKQIMIDAYEAMAGAFKAIVGIPVVGPAMAPAAAGAAFATVAGFAGSIPSAEGGWDIPAGATGMMRYHEKEMMLPAKYADVIRGMAEGGGAKPAPQVNISVTAMDSQDVHRALVRGGALSGALKTLNRNFAR